MTTVSIACDVSQPDGTEFATARLEFALSGPDYDTAAGEAIPAVTTYVDLDASGVGTADLWPVDLGTRNTFYAVVLRGSVMRDGRTSEFVSTLGRIQPQSSGGQTLADLLAQSSGGIVVGSVIYETLADAVAAALEAAAAGADPVAAIAARDKAQEWAENPVDEPVEPGQYSSMHHAAKAALDRDAAELAAVEANAAVPFSVNDAAAFGTKTTSWAVDAVVKAKTSEAWRIAAPGAGDFDHPITGQGVLAVKTGGVVLLDTMGAIGDDTADDAAALERGIRALSRLGGGVLRLTSGRTYRIATEVWVDDYAQGADLHIDLNGATLHFVDAGLTVIAASTTILDSTLGADVTRGDFSVSSTAAPTGVQRGDFLEILSPARMLYSMQCQHYYRVSDVTDGLIYLDGSAIADITAAQVIADGQSGDITLRVFRYGGDFSIYGGKITHTYSGTDAQGGAINVSSFSRADAHSIKTGGQCRRWFGANYCIKSSVFGCTFEDQGYVYGAQDYINTGSSPSGLAFGYAYLTSRVASALFACNQVGRGWHGPDYSRGTMYGAVKSNTFNRCSGAVSGHEGSWTLDVSGNTFNGGTGILGFRSVYLYIRDNHFLNMAGHSISYLAAVVELVVGGNTFLYSGSELQGQQVVYQGAGATPHGVRSARPKRIMACANIFSAVLNAAGTGERSANFGFAQEPGITYIATVTKNTFHGVVLGTGVGDGELSVTDNDIILGGSSDAFIPIRIGLTGAARVLAQGNKAVGSSTVGSSSLMRINVDAGTPRYIDVIDNNSGDLPGGVLRGNALVYRNVLKNVAPNGPIMYGSLPGQAITNLIGNYYASVTSIDFANATTVTKATGNERLGVAAIGDSATAAQLANIGDAINTRLKTPGRQVWDSTNNRMMRASGATPASAWWVLDGSASVTPA